MFCLQRKIWIGLFFIALLFFSVGEGLCLEGICGAENLLAPQIYLDNDAIKSVFIRADSLEGIRQLVTPIDNQYKQKHLIEEAVKEYHNLKISGKKIEEFRGIWQAKEINAADLWEFMLKVTALPVTKNIQRRMGEKTEFLHIERVVNLLKLFGVHSSNKTQIKDILDFLEKENCYQKITLDTGEKINLILARYQKLSFEQRKILSLAVVLHDYGKVVNLIEHGSAAEKIVFQLLDKFMQAKILTDREQYLILCLVVLHTEFGTLHFLAGLPQRISMYLEKKIKVLIDKKFSFDSSEFEKEYYLLASILYFIDFSSVGLPVATDKHIDAADFLAEKDNFAQLLDKRLYAKSKLWSGYFGQNNEVVDFQHLQDCKENSAALSELKKFTFQERAYLYEEFLPNVANTYLTFIFRQMKEENPANVIRLIYFLMRSQQAYSEQEQVLFVSGLNVGDVITKAKLVNEFMDQRKDEFSITNMRGLFKDYSDKVGQVSDVLGLKIVRDGSAMDLDFGIFANQEAELGQYDQIIFKEKEVPEFSKDNLELIGSAI